MAFGRQIQSVLESRQSRSNIKASYDTFDDHHLDGTKSSALCLYIFGTNSFIGRRKDTLNQVKVIQMLPVPKIDRLAGIECYCTSFAGIGGSIKHASEGFRVSEMVDESALKDTSSTYDERHRYPVFVLEKWNIDSNHAVIEIEREHRIRLKVLGIKDAKAVTQQYASSEHTIKSPQNEIRTRHTRLLLRGFTKKPLERSNLAGNEFTISIYNPKTADIISFLPQIEAIGNFYGLQRFGSERLVTHLVGREIIRKNFRKAVDLLLSYTTEFDSPVSREIRAKSNDPKNFPKLLKQIPRGMDIEYDLMSALVAGKDPVAALRAIPITIRRLFVQAYQAYIFNKTLSAAVMDSQNLTMPKEGDLCFEMEGPAIFGRIKKFDREAKTKMVPAIRMAGYTFQPGKGRFEIITKRILQEEQVSPKDFYIKEMQELSQQGGFRQAPLWCIDFSQVSPSPFTVSFKLPKGSYATTLLREMIKPDNPISAGF